MARVFRIKFDNLLFARQRHLSTGQDEDIASSYFASQYGVQQQQQQQQQQHQVSRKTTSSSQMTQETRVKTTTSGRQDTVRTTNQVLMLTQGSRLEISSGNL